ncbi:hypothetical protein G7Y89_g5575 [Cudoniella acicularis]|uniref:CAP-Gly domain-containing protein n=1 Tax=Cudoniella acicularis TaxID=354080 RepID=A0A8H4RPH8_9HELO|nr:hypothetical protein G7Y89_g5575 [Cudoniella acicularis]
MSFKSKYHVGQRVCFDSLGTIRYIGPVEGTGPEKEWLGIEWDNNERGKHNGVFKGRRYFTCLSSSPTVASFIRSNRLSNHERNFVEAVHEKYATVSLPEKPIEISGKIAEEIGFDKIWKEQSKLQELKIVLVDGLRINKAGDGQNIRATCPKIVELDLSRNLFQDIEEVVKICGELDDLKSLKLKFTNINLDHGRREEFSRIKQLEMDEMLMPFEVLAGFARQFPSLIVLAASSNFFASIPCSLEIPNLTSLTMEYNKFTSFFDLSPLASLKSLENLHLKGNDISEIMPPIESSGTDLESSRTAPVFGNKLRYIDLSYNNIGSWKFVDDLPSVFPGMTALRLSHNPIYGGIGMAKGSPTSIEEGYMFTVARLKNLKILNFSNVMTADRTNAEMFYLSRISKAIAEAPESEEASIIAQHKRYEELCEIYGAPTIVRKGADAINPDSLEARLINFTFYKRAKKEGGIDETITLKREIPKSFDIYRVKGIVGRMFGLPPLNIRLTWETGQWDPVAGYEENEDSSDDEWDEKIEDALVKTANAKRGKWMEREVEIEDSTRQVGFCVDGSEAKIRVEPSPKPNSKMPSSTQPDVEAHSQNQKRKTPWPSYFLVRKTGEVVPLIAVDELPPSLDLVGVPRNLDLAETVGMLNLGIQRSCGAYYRVEMGREETPRSEKDESTAAKPRPTITTTLPTKPIPTAPQAIRQPPPTPVFSAPSSPSQSLPPTQTQLCRHWCKHGICKWDQQCRYRHIMPMTLHGLQEVGLSDWPAWYRGQNPGFFAAESSAGMIRRGKRVVRDQERGKVLRSEELGEQIIRRLRNLEASKSKERKASSGDEGEECGEVG